MPPEIMIDETTARLNTHEAVCAERYEQIMDKFETGTEKMEVLEYRLTKLDKKLAWIGGGIAILTTFGPHVLDMVRGLVR